MTTVVAIDDAKKNEFGIRYSRRIPFLDSAADNPALPSAFLSQGEPNRVIEPHYHDADEFLLIVGGGGVLGRHTVRPLTVFFARANTAYGPIVGNAETGISFFVLFRNYDPGAKYLPAMRDALKSIRDRRPLAIARELKLPEPNTLPASEVRWEDQADMCNDEGLFVKMLSAGPGQTSMAPDPSGGGGQYIIVVSGSLIHGDKICRQNSLIHLHAHDPAFRIQAGKEGVQAVVMNFPGTPGIAKAGAGPVSAGRKWRCELCEFTYSEADGLPGEDLPPGTSWEAIPEDWSCPHCASGKQEFSLLESGSLP